MPTGVSIRWFESGHCVHPGFMVKPGSGFAPRQFPAGVALIDHPTQGKLLFDTGYHAHFADKTRHFPERFYALVTPHTLHQGDSAKEQMAELGIDANTVAHLVLSHFHGDHIAGVSDYPNAKLYCGPAGYDFLTRKNRLQRLQKGYIRELMPDDAEARLTFVDQFELDVGEILQLADGKLGLAATDLFGDESLYLVSLPGHAAGQLGLLVRLQHEFIFLLADACWLIDNLRDGINQHWLANVLCDDRHVYLETINKLRHAYQQAADRVVFVPSHCQETSQQLLQRGWMR